VSSNCSCGWRIPDWLHLPHHWILYAQLPLIIIGLELVSISNGCYLQFATEDSGKTDTIVAGGVRVNMGIMVIDDFFWLTRGCSWEIWNRHVCCCEYEVKVLSFWLWMGQWMAVNLYPFACWPRATDAFALTEYKFIKHALDMRLLMWFHWCNRKN
jgi:hypothetical protein